VCVTWLDACLTIERAILTDMLNGFGLTEWLLKFPKGLESTKRPWCLCRVGQTNYTFVCKVPIRYTWQGC